MKMIPHQQQRNQPQHRQQPPRQLRPLGIGSVTLTVTLITTMIGAAFTKRWRRMNLIGRWNQERHPRTIPGRHGLLMGDITSTSRLAVPGNMETRQCKDCICFKIDFAPVFSRHSHMITSEWYRLYSNNWLVPLDWEVRFLFSLLCLVIIYQTLVKWLTMIATFKNCSVYLQLIWSRKYKVALLT